MSKPRHRVKAQGIRYGAAAIPSSTDGLKPTSRYMRGGATGSSPFFFNWNVALREQREDVQLAYADAAARAIDAVQNSGWLAGAVEQSIATTIGTGLRLASRPDRVALGWDADKASKWSDIVERRWSTYSERAIECDAAAKQNVAQQQDSVLKHTFNFGEALGLLPFIKRPFNMNGTKGMLLPPTRLRYEDHNTRENRYQGVRTDAYGMPISYNIRKSADDFRGVDLRARDGIGRPQVAHIFEGQPGQMRGITPLAPVLKVVRQFDQLADTTLQAALIQTIFSATLEGQAPTGEILQALQTEEEQDDDQGINGPGFDPYMQARSGWYNGTKIDLTAGARVAHLFPGETLKFNKSEHPNENYEAFAKFLLREIARCLGMTFETLSGDYSGATYSSVRMATSEIWPIILRRRQIAAAYTQMLFEAWLEEEIEQGHIPFDNGLLGFMANRPAAVLANWRGPAKPQADDLKTAKAHEVYKNMGVMSDERIADDLGFDIDDEYERRQREMETRKRLGLPEHKTMEPDPLAEGLITEREAA